VNHKPVAQNVLSETEIKYKTAAAQVVLTERLKMVVLDSGTHQDQVIVIVLTNGQIALK
jgi:hypothetical protein